jgi:hypothetical protein
MAETGGKGMTIILRIPDSFRIASMTLVKPDSAHTHVFSHAFTLHDVLVVTVKKTGEHFYEAVETAEEAEHE